MGWPRSTGRKGAMLRCQQIAAEMFRDWRPHRSDWQPNERDRANARRWIATMREALDVWESRL